MYNNFIRDLRLAQKGEKQVASLLKQAGFRVRGFNDTYTHDFLIQVGKDKLHIEIKEDFMCERTGNIAVEYECRGRASGVATTKADFIIYRIHTPAGIRHSVSRVELLQTMISNKVYSRQVTGGDPGSNTRMYLFPIAYWQAIFPLYKDAGIALAGSLARVKSQEQHNIVGKQFAETQNIR